MHENPSMKPTNWRPWATIACNCHWLDGSYIAYRKYWILCIQNTRFHGWVIYFTEKIFLMECISNVFKIIQQNHVLDRRNARHNTG
jgi:hypothetical protein